MYVCVWCFIFAIFARQYTMYEVHLDSINPIIAKKNPSWLLLSASSPPLHPFITPTTFPSFTFPFFFFAPPFFPDVLVLLPFLCFQLFFLIFLFSPLHLCLPFEFLPSLVSLVCCFLSSVYSDLLCSSFTFSFFYFWSIIRLLKNHNMTVHTIINHKNYY